jgi:hypothetical protein
MKQARIAYVDFVFLRDYPNAMNTLPAPLSCIIFEAGFIVRG